MVPGRLVLLVTLALGVLSAPLPADTQPAKVPRVGHVTPVSSSVVTLFLLIHLHHSCHATLVN
jgi:hypothetical protein